MPSFFVDRRVQPNGDHEVHDRSRCPPPCFPREGDAEYLGEFEDGSQALAVARLRYHRVNGCVWCATEFHTQEIAVEEVWPELPGPGGAARVLAALPEGSWLTI